jgi:hypothetical protein
VERHIFPGKQEVATHKPLAPSFPGEKGGLFYLYLQMRVVLPTYQIRNKIRTKQYKERWGNVSTLFVLLPGLYGLRNSQRGASSHH